MKIRSGKCGPIIQTDLGEDLCRYMYLVNVRYALSIGMPTCGEISANGRVSVVSENICRIIRNCLDCVNKTVTVDKMNVVVSKF